MRPHAHVIDKFVWQPISETNCDYAFAFGQEWSNAASALSLRRMRHLGSGGQSYGSSVPSRTVETYALASDQQLVVEWHSGSAGPPSSTETQVLRVALTE